MFGLVLAIITPQPTCGKRLIATRKKQAGNIRRAIARGPPAGQAPVVTGSGAAAARRSGRLTKYAKIEAMIMICMA